MVYRALRFLFRIAVRMFFRRIEVEGARNVPETGPVLLLPNHPNALIDALVVLMHVDRPVSLTAKSTLLDFAFLKYLFGTVKVIPFHRKQDVPLGADRTRNVEALTECRRRLEDGGAICIFPEGQSHSDPSLRPFRWGAARIALDYWNVRGSSGENSGKSLAPLKIIPVGLNFLHKERFRSDVWVRFGDPVDLGAWMRDNPEGGPAELTTAIEERVHTLTLNFERRRDSILMDWAAEILSTGGMPPAPIGQEKKQASAHLSLVRLIRDGYEELRDTKTREIEDLRRRVRLYRSELRRLGIAPSEVYILMTAWRAVFFVFRESAVLLIGLPLAIWGVMNHLVPALIVRTVARSITVEKDQWASNVVFPAVVVFPLFYAAQLILAWLFLAPTWAAVYTVMLPVSGYGAIRYADRAGGSVQRSRTFIRFLVQPELRSKLAEDGREIIERFQRLGEEMGRSSVKSEG